MKRASWHAQGLVAALFVVLSSSFGCGPEDTLSAWEVTLVPFDDCSQVGAGAPQCADEQVLREVSTTGRWFFDARGTDTFALTTDTGLQMPGVFFENNGGLLAEPVCTGQGGRCYFSKSRTDSVDEETGCLRITERTVIALELDGELTGEMSDAIFNDQSCGTSNIRVVLTEVRGHALDEDVHAREDLAP